ncbi:Protein LURP-one-related 12 [Linum perenne]
MAGEIGGAVPAAIVDDKFCYGEETNLTVRKTSVFFPGDGFVVYDPNGDVIFRFDSYGPETKDELVLMDASGKCLLTLIRKKPSLHNRWEGFLGDKTQNPTTHLNGVDPSGGPIFTAFKSSIIGHSSLIVELYGTVGEEYLIEGSYVHRSCTVYYTPILQNQESSSKEAVAEIKRKVDPTTHVILGRDVFWLSLKPGFDAAFAMGLVLILDHMFDDRVLDGDDDVQGGDAEAGLL